MTDERTKAYLLQELTEREAEQFEEQCFAQPEWPADELDCAEDDLIEAYLLNKLSPDRRRRFENNYLITNARKERVLLARYFLPVVSPQLTWAERFKRFWTVDALVPKYATVTALLLLSVALLLSYRSSGPRTFADLNLTIASEKRDQGASNAPTQKIKLPLGADALRISLTLPESAPKGSSYSVQWENITGPLKTWEIKLQDAGAIQVVIPADDLSPGQYALKLWRINADGTKQRINGSYFFDVDA